MTQGVDAPGNELLIPNAPFGLLDAHETYTGPWIECYQWQSLVVSSFSDVDGTLRIQFSTNAQDADLPISYDVTANSPEGPHRLIIGRRYMRLIYENNGTAQTVCRLSVIAGNHSPISSAVSSQIKLDADAIITRSIPPNFDVARGNFVGISQNNKVGKNSDVPNSTSITSPEFITEQGGFYTGFPINTAEPVRVISTSANDTAAGTRARSVQIIGIDENWDIQSESIPLNGTTAVESSGTYRRIHTMFVETSGSDVAANEGTISVYHSTTTANVFATILPNVGSSNYAVYTIPRNYVGIIFQTKVEVLRSQSASISGAYWVRPFQGSPRFIRPYTASNAAPDEQAIPNGITFPEKTDLALTITSCSNNNTTVIGRFDIVLVSTIL